MSVGTVSEDEDGAVHVMPLGDMHEHETSCDCWCGPQEDEYGVVVHNSFDGREDYEVGSRKVH
ncbi:hypothetical protein [Pseudoduganella chitinolytica]|uniref:Uncharacterized protein n=1 Tax=Pseudoduganella chitinolytica TaxID=34070 RepID=A0ABY8BGC0_9BURK|nr:hypothetical protein [Pseudoduganella chitinolytica]WEF34870.1 hypothetical protein PX653_08940 [Pseudoduganella chitinolytica]